MMLVSCCCGRAWVSEPLSGGRIEQMNVVGTRGDRDRVALARNVVGGDTNADQRSRAVEIEHGGVAEVLDEVDAGLDAVGHDAQRARADADHDIPFTRYLARR